MRLSSCSLLALLTAGLYACGPARQAVVEAQAPAVMGLPALPGGSSPGRQADITGPGWLKLPPQSYALSSGAEDQPDGSVILDAQAGVAYAVFSVGGFPESDALPTSARITVAPAGGDFYVAFSDYIAGRWGLAGPFTDSAEVEQPLPEGAQGYGGPAAFISPAGATHFAVVATPGASLQVTQVELGIQENNDAPLPVTFARYTGQANPLVLTWQPSPSYKELDFAGYLIERAPRYFGSFESLSPAPVPDLYFLDDSVDPAQQYRIRIAAVDTSGDQSAWFTVYGPSGELADPICSLDIPDGPLVGPVTVAFDMSGSFDPLGEAISDYQITFDSSGPAAMGAEPVKTLTLQPGSYNIGASIITQDSFRYGSTQRQLTVLPQWEAAPTVLRAPTEGDDNQLVGVDCYRDSQTGRLVFTAYDRNLPGLAFIRDLGGGNYAEQVGPPLEASDYYEPYPVGLEHAVPLCNAAFTHAIATADGGDPRYLLVTGTYAQPSNVITSFADSDGRLWLLQLAGSALRATRLDNPNEYKNLITGIVYCDWACPLLDETTGLLHIAANVYNFAAEYHLRYVQFDPVTLASSEEEVGQMQVSYPDIELNPASGEPGIAAYNDQGYVFLAQRNGADDWTSPVLVDNSNANGPFDLEYGQSSGALVYLSITTCQLYAYNGTDFDVRNDPSFTADICDSLAMEPLPGTDDMEAITAVSTGETYHATLHADGSDTVHKEFLPQEACAQHLSAAASGGYLQVVGRSGIDNHSEHFEYDPFGPGAQQLADYGACEWQELTATSDGTVYSAHGNGIEQALDYWDGDSWEHVKVYGTSPTHMALLSNSIEPALRWIAFTGSPSPTLKFFYGNDPSDSGQDYAYPYDILFGCLSGSSGFSRALIAEGGAGSSNVDSLTLWRASNQARTPLYDPPGDAPQEYFTAVTDFGYPTAFALGGGQQFWCAVGPGGGPVRIAVQPSGLADIAALPGAWDGSLAEGGDPYRTVNAVLAGGDTPVCITASLLGEQLRLEWLNDGAWEALPLPPGFGPGGTEHVSKPELAVVLGSLVLIWHDFETQQIKAWQTQMPPPA